MIPDAADEPLLELREPNALVDDFHLALRASRRDVDPTVSPRVLVRGLTGVRVVLAGRTWRLAAHHLTWSFASPPEADGDRLTVLVPAEEAFVAELPEPCRRSFRPSARALYLFDHWGAHFSRWGTGDLRVSGLYHPPEQGAETVWQILDAAIEQGVDVEWFEDGLRSPTVDAQVLGTRPVVVEQIYDAPVETVWKAITDGAQMRSWFFEAIDDFEPTVGFEAAFPVRANGRDYPHRWTVTEVVPTEVIAYRWRYDGMPGDSHVRWELRETTDGTKLTVTHTGHESFPQDDTAFSRDSCQQGWHYFVCESLHAFLAASA